MDGFVKTTSAALAAVSQKNKPAMVSNFFVKHATSVTITALTLLIVLATVIFYQHGQEAAVARALVTHTYEVRSHIRSLLARIEDAVIGERGFLIGGREEYLGSYNAAMGKAGLENSGSVSHASLSDELIILKKLTADNPTQQQNLETVARMTADMSSHLASMIELRRAEGAGALQKIDPNHSEQLLEQLRNKLDDMTEEENRLLAIRLQADQAGVEHSNLLIFSAIGVFYIVVVLAIRFCQKAEKLARVQLEQSEQRSSLAIQGLSVGLWDWNIITGGIYWSPRFMEIMGIKDPTYTPRLDVFEQLLHPHDRKRVMDTLSAHLEGKGPFDVEYQIRREDGVYIWLHAMGKAMWDDARKPMRMVGSVDDVTERKQAEKDREDYVGALKRSNQELDDFAYIASHDLKEPLRGLTNNAMFIKEDMGEHLELETVKRLDRMTYLCQRLERLVDDLLYFSRLGRQKLAVQPSDFNEIIKDIKLTMETALQEANATIIVPEVLPTVVCDLPRITEVFRNLILNAVKYNKSAEKRIEIGCTDLVKLPAANANEKQGQAFYVRDNGIGIPEQFYGDIFRIFKRLNEESDNLKGTGVGLTFVRKIVERHGGRIWLDSEVGKGTTFYFTLNPKTEAQS